MTTRPIQIMKTKLSILALFILLAASCTKLDKFSDDNAVTAFTVTAHSPEEIIIDDVTIEDDVIYIPIVYGKYEFPLNIRASISTSPEVNKIVGLDFAKELILNDINSELKFHVVAESGATRTYYIRAREIPLDENNYIFGKAVYKAVSPANAILSTVTHGDSDRDLLRLFGVELDYPVTMTPEFNIAPSSRFERIWLENDAHSMWEYKNGETELTFQDASTTYCLRVVSQSGLARVWKISLTSCELLDEQSPATPDVSVDPRTLSVTGIQSGLTVIETLVDNLAGSITIITEKPSPGQPFSLNFQMPANDLIDLIGNDADGVLTFDPFDEVKTFYILDPHDKVAKKWTVSLSEFKSNLARVLSFSYDYDAGLIKIVSSSTGPAETPSIVMDPSRVVINTKEREVVLYYTKYQNDNYTATPNWWGFTLKDISITLSDGATCTMPTISWLATARNKAAGLLAEARTFVVKAADGTASTWSIKLLSASSSLSSECEIKSMAIEKVIPSYTRFEDNPLEVDHGNHNILIFLKDDDGCYPMQIFPNYVLSPYASVTSQGDETRPLTFASSQSVETVTVRAQNGTMQNYTVQLISPAKSENADIVSIGFEAPKPVDFTFNGEATYDAAKGIITLHVVGNDPAFPLTIPYDGITLSDNATTSTPVRGNFVFSRSSEKVPIAVRAQNGSNKVWYVVLDYRPQLRNWNLNSWSGNTPQPAGYWATANTTGIVTMTGTKQGGSWSGESGDLCAVMASLKAPIVNTLAAGTLFIGKFDSSNILGGLSDPVSLTFFGVPFAPTARIKGIMIDVFYHSNTIGGDWGSAAVNLIHWDGVGEYIFHGDKPKDDKDPLKGSAPHPKNTATIAAEGLVRFGTGAVAITKYGDPVTLLTDNEWKKDLFIPVDGTKPFTHISVTFSSSAYGDYFSGEVGSTIKVDNIRIVYE